MKVEEVIIKFEHECVGQVIEQNVTLEIQIKDMQQLLKDYKDIKAALGATPDELRIYLGL